MNDFLSSNGDTLLIVLKLLGIYFILIWVSLVVWVIKDVTNRTTSIPLQIFSVLTVLVFSPLGVFIYLLIRPQKTLFETFYEEEFRALEARMMEAGVEEIEIKNKKELGETIINRVKEKVEKEES